MFYASKLHGLTDRGTVLLLKDSEERKIRSTTLADKLLHSEIHRYMNFLRSQRYAFSQLAAAIAGEEFIHQTDFSVLRLEQTGTQLQQSGLTCAIRAHDGNGLAAGHVKANLVKHGL